MKRHLIIFAASVILLISAPLFANDVASDYTEYTFDDDVLIGELVRPDDANITARPKGAERSLLKIRTHFVLQMLKSVEDI